jgi:methionine--tRNA ligase beta chain
MVSFDEFKRLDMKVGEIISVDKVPNADKLYSLQVDIGEKQIRLVAGLRQIYNESDLRGKKIIVLTNLEPVTIRGVRSEGMLLAAVDGDDASLLTVDRPIRTGSDVA